MLKGGTTGALIKWWGELKEGALSRLSTPHILRCGQDLGRELVIIVGHHVSTFQTFTHEFRKAANASPELSRLTLMFIKNGRGFIIQFLH